MFCYMNSQPIRVLQVLPSLGKSTGVARVVYNLYNYIDEDRFHFDFLHHAVVNGVPLRRDSFDSELIERGSAVYTVNYASADLPRFIREVHGLIAKVGQSYDIIHCHMPNSAFCILKEAKKAGIEHRVLHSHLNNSSDSYAHRLRNAPLLMIGKRYATDRMACSEEAGSFLFGRKPFIVIKNGIPLERYKYDPRSSKDLRSEFGIGINDHVIGCVGRFVPQKNYDFALKIFSSFARIDSGCHLVILGGELNGATVVRDALRAKAERLGISERVHFPGVRLDAESFYSMFDVFFMPSLYEGLPVSAVEAQAAGLHCVYSDGVPHETDISGTGEFVSLNAPADSWIKALESAIQRGRVCDSAAALELAGYSAKVNAGILMDQYERIVHESN